MSALADDPRFADLEARGRNREALLALLSERFAERTTTAWMDTLRGRMPIAPVRSMEDALDPDELRSRGMMAEYQHPSFGSVRSVGLPLVMGGFAPEYGPGPGLGADAAEILGRLGYADDDVAELRAAGAFGPRQPRPEVRPEAAGE